MNLEYLFVLGIKVTDISQQKLYQVFDYIDKGIVSNTCEKYWMPCVPCKSFVADIWIDFENEKAYLLECNPVGVHSASGSALLHWVRDLDVLYARKKVTITISCKNITNLSFVRSNFNVN